MRTFGQITLCLMLKQTPPFPLPSIIFHTLVSLPHLVPSISLKPWDILIRKRPVEAGTTTFLKNTSECVLSPFPKGKIISSKYLSSNRLIKNFLPIIINIIRLIKSMLHIVTCLYAKGKTHSAISSKRTIYTRYS